MGAPLCIEVSSGTGTVSAYALRAASAIDVNPVAAGQVVEMERVEKDEMRYSNHRAESGLFVGVAYTSARSPVFGGASKDVSVVPLASVVGGRNNVFPDGEAQTTDVPTVAKSSTAVSVMSASP